MIKARKTVTRCDAEKVLAVVKEVWAVYLDDEGNGPVIMEDYNGARFAIVWEEGPFEWAIGFDPEHPQYDEEASCMVGRKVERPAATTHKMPSHIFVEPYFSFDLCLYLA